MVGTQTECVRFLCNLKRNSFQNTQPTLRDVLCLNRVQLRGQNAFTQEQQFSR